MTDSPTPNVQNGQFEFLHLVGVDVTFKGRYPKYPVKLKLEAANGEPKSKEFESGDAILRWEPGFYFTPKANLEVSVKESHTIRWRTKKDFASVQFEPADIKRNVLVTKEDSDGLISVKLTFVPPANASDVLLKGAEEAADLLEKKPVALEKLGKARKFIEVAKNFSTFISQLHPAARAAVIAFDILYERLEKQEQLHDDASDLIEDMNLFLPFTEVVDPSTLASELARSAIEDFLDLFKDTCEFIVTYSSSGILGDLISSHRGKIEQLEKDFRKVKSRYDWSIMTDVWRATLKLEKYHDEEILRLLQVSFSGPPGKEYFRSDRCCLPGTRLDVLEQIAQWAESTSSQSIFWLHGIAGSGKSAIANTIAQTFDGQRLLAGCFFCKRDDPDLRNTEKVIPSLAFHLAAWHQPYSAKLLAVLQSDEKNKLASKTVQEQFELLIQGPALSLTGDQQIETPRPLIIVIDALDECGENRMQRLHLTRVLVRLANLVPWLKLLVTSRPLHELGQVFETASDTLEKLHLNQAVDPTPDIILYSHYRADEIAEENALEPTWLSDEQIVTLAQRACGLFIWATTVFNFIQKHIDVDHAVTVIFSSTSNSENPEEALDELYKTVLRDVASGSANNLWLVKTVTGVIFCTAKNVPLTVDALHSLAPEVSETLISRIVERLQAVLYRDADLQNAVRVCHPSFLDFMSQQTRSVDFWTMPEELDSKVATRCLQIMRENLQFNMCQLETSYVANEDIPDLQRKVATTISRALSYSCLNWMSHFQGSDVPKQEELVRFIEGILRSDIAFYWIEALSLLQELKKGVQILSQAIVTFTESQLKTIALDLFRFVSAFYDAISTCTPHLYISALAWLPPECLLAQTAKTSFITQEVIAEGKSMHWPKTLLTIPERAMVRVVTYSLDGQNIACGTTTGTISIRDGQTGDVKVPPIRAHTGQTTSVVFSPDGKLLASSGQDQTIRIWDVESGMPDGDVMEIDTAISSLAFLPDGKRIIAGANDRTIRIWDVENRKQVGEPIQGYSVGDHIGTIRDVAVSPDGRYFASASDGKVLQIWDAKTGEAVGKPLEGHTNWVVAVTFSPDGSSLVSGSYDHTIRRWDVATGRPLGEPFRGHTDYVSSVAVSPDGKLVVSSSHDNTVRIWDSQTGKPIDAPLRSHTDWVLSVAFSPDGKHFISGSHDRTLRIWDIESGEQGEELLEGKITSVAISPDGRHVASGSTEKIIQLWDTENGKIVGKFEGHTRWVNAIAFSSDGKYLVSGSDDTTVCIWDAETSSVLVKTLDGHSGWITSVTFSPDDKKVASGSQDKSIRVWDVDTGKLLRELLEDGDDWDAWVRSIAFSPDGTRLVSGLENSLVKVWNLEDGNPVGEPFSGHNNHVYSVAYSPDAQCVASCSFDGSIRIWNVETRTCEILFDYEGEPSQMQSIAYSPDGSRLVSGSDEKVIQIWDTASGEAVGESYIGHTGKVVSVAYSRDGTKVVSGSDDRTIRAWITERFEDDRGSNIDGVPPRKVPDDGWIRTNAGELFLWVPVQHRKGICDMSCMCIPADALDHPVRVTWDKLCHGTSWTNVKKKRF
ncbi:WD40 repeat-like protein [Fomitiporia mediterranea MF3/22]|uniref:WD40 repeat-like protein n=1 Tax=Fomitiporia mediterranea (strain MF3/22) TaxID=694068 RepID=UPI0004407AB6|nr:WD40 repeat-like protein [Fomitiporia mediterranea MF3/22]EJD07930.1 WD40 repeat-like protein [Fomitiporia mediterranea MF3/22]